MKPIIKKLFYSNKAEYKYIKEMPLGYKKITSEATRGVAKKIVRRYFFQYYLF